MNNKTLEAIIKKEMLINIGINRNNSCIWILLFERFWPCNSWLIETIVVFELACLIGIAIAKARLIETIVVFECFSNAVLEFSNCRLIETIVVFELKYLTRFGRSEVGLIETIVVFEFVK